MLVLPRVLSVVSVSGLLVGLVLARVIPELSQQQVLGSGSEGGNGYGSLRRFKAIDISLLEVLQIAQVRYDSYLYLSRTQAKKAD